MTIRDRIKELRRVRAADLAPHPHNWRIHPDGQREVLRALLAEIGYANALIARERTDGTLQLIDGHLRAETTPDQEVPVLVTDLTEAEAATLLATLDPLAGMAETDIAALDSLLNEVQGGSDAVASLLAELRPTEPSAVPSESVESQFAVYLDCESEGEQHLIIEELMRHGLAPKALTVPRPPERTSPKAPPPNVKVTGKRIVRECRIERTPRVVQVEGIFDLPPATTAAREWTVDLTLNRPWQVGLIVGPSGSGKSTLAREVFGHALIDGWDWPADRAIVDAFPAAMTATEVTGLLSSVGLSSPPTWLKPFRVLSNGEQFRASLARTLAEKPDLAVVDEFTSVVDRTVARIGSAAVAKCVRNSGRRLVAVTCHYDVEEWLQPDWVFDAAAGKLTWRLLRPRPPIQLHVRRADASAWPLFRHHHYLSGELARSAGCFLAEVEGKPAAFAAAMHSVGRRSFWREHRLVCLPDFQGVGIGNALSEFVASLYATKGKGYRSTTGHPAMIAHRLRSPMWRCVRRPSLVGSGDKGVVGYARTRSTSRLTASFEYVGEACPTESRRLGVI